MSLIKELKHLPVLQSFIKIWSYSNDYHCNKPPSNLVVWNDNIFVVHESVISVGLARNSLPPLQSVSAEDWCHLNVVHAWIWRLILTVGWNAYMLFPFILVFLTIWQTECPERESQADSVLPFMTQLQKSCSIGFPAFCLSRRSQRPAQVYGEREQTPPLDGTMGEFWKVMWD